MAVETETTHCFEKAGLGKAPFRYVGMEYQDISYGMRNVSIGGVICQTKPGGTCDYCGTYIVNMFRVESSDGKQFKVGCDCIMKTGDAGLVRLVKQAVSAMERKRKMEKRLVKESADKELCMLADLGKLNGKPHPNPLRNAGGESLGDWARWMRDNRYYKTLAGVIRRELVVG